jgi:hypothetical protein
LIDYAIMTAMIHNHRSWPFRHGSCFVVSMRRSLFLVVLVTLACAARAQGQSAGSRDAFGAEATWRYCLAVSETAATVYLSAPLLTSTPLDALERKFDRRVSETVADHHPSLCPLASRAVWIINATLLDTARLRVVERRRSRAST